MKKTAIILSAAVLAVCFAACRNDEPTEPERHQPAEGVEEETYAGGVLGTTFNRSASAYEDPTPAVEQAGMVNAFKYGEFFFEHTITQNNPPFNGLDQLICYRLFPCTKATGNSTAMPHPAQYQTRCYSGC